MRVPDADARYGAIQAGFDAGNGTTRRHCPLVGPARSQADSDSAEESGSSAVYAETVTRRKVAGMDVAFGLVFWLLNSASSSVCRSVARQFFSAASKAFMVGP